MNNRTQSLTLTTLNSSSKHTQRLKLPTAPVGKRGWPWTGSVKKLSPNMPNGKSWPRITVVTPAYNQGQFLEETMRSVLMQGYPNLEYMVINDGSTDNTVEIIKEYEPYLDYWTTQTNSGQPTAVNTGMARSTGEILAWLNSDDLLLPRALERVALARMRNPEIKITCGFREVIDADSRVLGHWVHPRPCNYDLMRICYIAQETVFWSREVWEKAGPLGANWRYALDFDLWQKFMAAGYTFHLLPYFIGAFRRHPESKGSTMEHVRQEELREIYKRHLGRDIYERTLLDETCYVERTRLMARLAKLRLFHCPPLADFLLDRVYKTQAT
jgi:glycosyltransferase involved in cell wall biosynthesis